MIKIEDIKFLTLGQQGENEATILEIDMTSWVEALAADGIDNDNIRCHILFKPFGETIPVPATSEWDTTTKVLTWEIGSSITAIEGQGYAEIWAIEHFTEDDPDEYAGLIKKSRVIPAVVNHSLSGISTSEIPLPYKDWVTGVFALRDQIKDIFQSATMSYAIGESNTTAPTTGWQDTIPELITNKRKYLWIRATFEWSVEEDTVIEFPVYIADDTEGAVTAVNGLTGNIILNGDNVMCDSEDPYSETPVSINTRFEQIKEDVIQPAIQPLYNLRIRYADIALSLDEPSAGVQTVGYQVQDASSNQVYFGYGIYTATIVPGQVPSIPDIHDQNFISATVVAVNGAAAPVGDYGLVFGAPVVKLRAYSEQPSLTDRTTFTVPFSDATLISGPRTYPETITLRVAYNDMPPST